jgi:hypothetical protein
MFLQSATIPEHAPSSAMGPWLRFLSILHARVLQIHACAMIKRLLYRLIMAQFWLC